MPVAPQEMLASHTEEGTCLRVAVPAIYIWLGFLCLEWPLPPSVSGLVCGHQREVKTSGKKEYASFSVVIARSHDDTPRW